MNVFDRMQSSAIVQADSMGAKLTSGAKKLALVGSIAVITALSSTALSAAPFPGQQETPASELPKLEIGTNGKPSIVTQAQEKTDDSKPAELYTMKDGRMLEVQKAEDSLGKKAVRLGGGALAGGLLGSMIGGGNGNTIATVVGAIGGAIAADKVFAPEDKVRVVDGNMATAYPPEKYKFTNGKNELTKEEYANLDEWVRGASFIRDQIASNRDNIQSLRRSVDLAGPKTEADIKRKLNQAMVDDTKLSKTFVNAQSHMSKKVWLAAMDYNKHIPEELLTRAGAVLDYKVADTYVTKNNEYIPITTNNNGRYETVRIKSPSVMDSVGKILKY